MEPTPSILEAKSDVVALAIAMRAIEIHYVCSKNTSVYGQWLPESLQESGGNNAVKQIETAACSMLRGAAALHHFRCKDANELDAPGYMKTFVQDARDNKLTIMFTSDGVPGRKAAEARPMPFVYPVILSQYNTIRMGSGRRRMHRVNAKRQISGDKNKKEKGSSTHTHKAMAVGDDL
ncbi:hypothetical protein EV424DRAFT_1350134 [Suillus variegatus]|nr:hypothetical protein EV424DRAFT_1350134 [Suillus variegatus]